MSTDNPSIHEFDFYLICEYFSSLERQGPGSPEMTLKALSFVENLPAEPSIVDIGCGTGAPTMVLARQLSGKITGIDLFPRFIDLFNENARKLDLQQRVKGITGNMENLPFKDEELDLIWCEGAVYNIGFERGLKEWRRFLKPGGCIALTEASWFTDERPPEIESFWNDAYPEINTIPVKTGQLHKAGYVPLAVFRLPEICWTDNFYKLQVRAQEAFLEKYPGNKNAMELVSYQRQEAALYSRYSQYYGYVFYIGRKTMG